MLKEDQSLAATSNSILASSGMRLPTLRDGHLHNQGNACQQMVLNVFFVLAHGHKGTGRKNGANGIPNGQATAATGPGISSSGTSSPAGGAPLPASAEGASVSGPTVMGLSTLKMCIHLISCRLHSPALQPADKKAFLAVLHALVATSTDVSYLLL